MHYIRMLMAVALCCVIPSIPLASEWEGGYAVTYAGGSLPTVKGGEELRLYIEAGRVRLNHKTVEVARIPARAITEVSYGQEVHRRIGTAAGLAVVSLGIGAIVAFSKSKKHYIGLTWAEGENRGGIALQADKNEYRGLIAALEGVSGRTAVDEDSPHGNIQANVTPQVRQQPTAPVVPSSETDTPKSIVVRFTSVPTAAEVLIDGEYWGTTPTADLMRIAAGPHTITVKKLGYLPWERKLTLAPGDDRTINAELERQPNDPTKPRIVGN